MFPALLPPVESLTRSPHPGHHHHHHHHHHHQQAFRYYFPYLPRTGTRSMKPVRSAPLGGPSHCIHLTVETEASPIWQPHQKHHHRTHSPRYSTCIPLCQYTLLNKPSIWLLLVLLVYPSFLLEFVLLPWSEVWSARVTSLILLVVVVVYPNVNILYCPLPTLSIHRILIYTF